MMSECPTCGTPNPVAKLQADIEELKDLSIRNLPALAKKIHDAQAAEIKQQAKQIAKAKGWMAELMKQNGAQADEIEQLKGQLFKYGRCLPDCNNKYTGGNCKCGWEQSLKESESE
jgi:hypothetical protein